ncbi:phage major capsid protein [Pseudarthrobacter sp. N5]|uniref:phage major capsid protein n=1 Tax=Pseudarthrobacter sp. N5 TaxID=3418416 RepID=UPI003CEB85A2
MSATLEAQRNIRELGTKAEAVLKNGRLSNTEKKSQLDGLTAELKRHQETLELSANAKRLMGGAESLNNGYAAAAASGIAAKGLATPSLSLGLDVQENLFMAAKSGANFRVELKDAASSDATRTQLPASLVPGVVDRRFEPVRILDHIPSGAMAGPSVEFITHTANTVGLAAPVITLGTAVAGGTFAAGTYFWKLTALSAAGETIGSNELTATLTANQLQPINWTAIPGATGHRLYRGTVAGGENVLVAVVGAVTTVTDTGTAGTNASVPLANSTAGAGAVAPGAAFPETSLTTTATILTARKLAVFSTVVDELLQDFPTFAQYLDVELQRQIVDAENWQILNGDGTGQNLLGLLKTTGTLVRAKAPTDAALDVLEQGITDLRNGPSFCEPDAIICHPSTWSTIRRVKNTLGNYILGDPGQTAVTDVWGTPVLQTTQIVPGTVILGNLQLATQAFIRDGVTLEMTNSADADFTSGKVKIRSTERLTIGVARPTALNILTGF